MKINFLDVANLLATEPPKLDFVLYGLTLGTTGVLVAPGATGKNFMALAIAIAICTGKQICNGLWDFTPSKGVVTLICGEDPEDIIHQRLKSISELMDDEDKDDLIKNLRVTSVLGQILQLTDVNGKLNDVIYSQLTEIAKDSRLLIIDTFRRFYGGDENSSSQVTFFLQHVEQIAKENNCAIILTHHSSKNATLNSGLDNPQAARGSSAITDNCRWSLNLAVMNQNESKENKVNSNDRHYYVQANLTKLNYSSPKPSQWLRRRKGGVLILDETLNSQFSKPKLVGVNK